MAYHRGPYWYKSVRNGAHVGKEYLGMGGRAQVTAQLDAMAQEERSERWAAIRAERQAQRDLDAPVNALGDAIRDLTRLVLEAHGYHMHKRQWRRQRW